MLVTDFITAFQFLTRIHLVTQSDWSPEGFGRSVKYFPLVGGIIGLLLAAVAYAVQYYGGNQVPVHVLAGGLIFLEVLITGGLHCDGFMDTIDGVFSGRSRERMLEIMKDSRVGAFGAIAFSLLVLVKYSLYLDIKPAFLPVACLAMPVVSRMAVVLAITLFPYARKEGLGKTFFQYADKKTVFIAALLTLLLLAPLGSIVIIGGAAALSFGYLFARYVNKKLEGLTGDVYGAVNELTEVAALLGFLIGGVAL